VPGAAGVDEEAVEGRGRAHDVAEPLAALIAAGDVPAPPLAELVEARRWDAHRDAFADEAALLRYLDDTGGGLMWAAAVVLGAGPRAEQPVRDIGRAAALANWLMAVPALEASGRIPLVDGRAQAVAALARDGLGWLARARAARADIPARAAPALLTGWRTGAILRQAAAEPGRVVAGALVQSEFARRGSLLLRSLTGRW
jgi:phytoene/squalene synthetase